MSVAEKLTTIAENEQKVYNAGQKAEYDRFWDNYQDNGNRTDYSYGFAGRGWNNETFKPKYDIIPKSTERMFSASRITDVISCLEKAKVVFDTSQDINATYLLDNSKVVRFPTYDARRRGDLQYFIYNNSDLEYVENIILKNDGSQTFGNFSFRNNPKLAEIRFEGVIGQDITFNGCNALSRDSLMSIINALKNFSGTETFANVEYVWTGNATSYSYDMVYNVIDIYNANDDFLSLQLETDELFEIPDGTGTTIPATLLLEIHNFTYYGDVTKIKTAMISSDGTLTLTLKAEPTKTLTLHADSKAKLTAAQIQSAEDKGWNVV